MDAAPATTQLEHAPIAQLSPARRRYHEIDGLRGWACMSVMLSHLFFGVFIKAEPPFIAPQWRYILMEPFLGGTLAVAVFFILSGDALSAPYWTRPSRTFLVRQTVKRYVRLTVPILGASTIVFVLIKAGLTFNHEAAPMLHVEDWLGNFLRGRFSIIDLLRFSGVTVYFQGPTERALLPFLWIMRLEMLGSMLLLVYLFADYQIRRRYAAIIFMLLVCLADDSMLTCFPIGMLCALARARGGFAWLQRQKLTEPIALIGFALALVIGTYCNRVWQGFLLPSIVAGGVVVTSVYASRTLIRFFSMPLSRWLGQISFPIFLLHFAVIVSFTSGVALLAHEHGLLSPPMMWLIVAASAALCIFISRLFLPVERFSGRAGNWTCDLMMRPEMPERSTLQSAT
ncbi:MAG: acyltransferase [Acetobacteraceae bacterium]|nr:acyltransferase [Acetobacteraceae bacterium]